MPHPKSIPPSPSHFNSENHELAHPPTSFTNISLFHLPHCCISKHACCYCKHVRPHVHFVGPLCGVEVDCTPTHVGGGWQWSHITGKMLWYACTQWLLQELILIEQCLQMIVQFTSVDCVIHNSQSYKGTYIVHIFL